MSTIPSADLAIPKLNEYWPGQGGLFKGLHPLGGYLIAAEALLKDEFQFGLYGKRLDDFSDIDGAENSRKLIELDSPAAKAATAYTRDGHSDFFLPAQRELMLVHVAQGRVADGPVVFSSSPFGSRYAWALGFELGSCFNWRRGHELAVLPVRRFIP
ncbi:DUF1566 domain-containing protein [Candidimonas humi]|uniref:DUF1566 domain-containing protein n=1 Tax=Candidimonas humi TaxID=683355 RepID=A0ABV8NYV8_9BURK|nr:DUF1566 domain-containing protein [Candidimonas humi]MBV6304901.1 DUF1566 domain-containing protein [Candidimonas humi]